VSAESGDRPATDGPVSVSDPSGAGFAHPRAHELHPQAAEILAAGAQSDRPNAHLLPVEEARRNFDADFAAVGPGDPVHEVVELHIEVDGGEIPARLYRPADGRLPVVVYFHGGGWLLGSVESHDAVCRALANAAGAAVVSVGYRRGPEHRFPVAVDDCYAAAQWVVDRADDLAVDPHRLAVAGDSAGANLATAVALLARDRGEPPVVFQLLAYPVTTTDLEKGFDLAYEGFSLYYDELRWHQDNYLSSPEDRRSPLVSPLDEAHLTGLPPAMVITAQCDPLHAQGELYASALAGAGVQVEHRHYPGMVHGFFQLPSLFDDGRDAVERAGAALRHAFRAQDGDGQ
jgi:acetyl esterase